MFLKSIELENFRNFSHYSASFSKFNYIFGKNGAGKSTLIEAIYFLMTGRTIRSGQLFKSQGHKPLIAFQTDHMKLKGLLETSGETRSIEISADPKKKIFSVDEKKLKKTSELFKLGRILTFHPGDISIIDDSPSFRRAYFDHEFSMIDSDYFEDILKIKRLLDERNGLLKKVQLGLKIDEDYLNSVTNTYISLTFSIVYNRINMLCAIQKECRNKGDIIYRLNNQFQFSEPEKDELKKAIVRLHDTVKNREKTYGYSLFGPQRDEYLFSENGSTIKEFYSTGEKMKWILELKLAINKVIKKRSRLSPLILMDDFFNFFDQRNYSDLLSNLTDNQVFFTSQECRSEIRDCFGSVNNIELVP